MINTIFYFPQSRLEFDAAGGINERTICFIPGSDDATGQIVMGGRNYSGTVDVNSLTQTIQNIIQTAMPIASSETAGAIKIGNGLDITTDGTTSVNEDYINGLISAYTEGAGTGGGNFSGWSWEGLYNNAEGKRSIGTLTINGTSKTIYIPKDVVGEGGGNADPYDDTELRSLLSGISDRITSEVRTLNDTIDGILSELDGILNETAEDVKNKIGSAFPTYKLLIQYYLENGDTTVNEYTFGQGDLDTWASQKGLIVDNGDGTYKVGWSELIQTVNGIDARVTQVEGLIGSGGGDVNYEILQAGLYAYIQDQIAQSGLESTWGRFATKDDIITEDDFSQWLQSKVTAEAGEGYTFANVVSAAKNYDTDSDAIASLKTRVDTIEGNYVSSTNLASQVNDSISGIFTQNSSNSAVAGLFSRVSGIETSTGTNASAISGLQTRVTTLENGDYLTQNSLVSAFVDNKDEIISQAGLVNTTGLNTAKSEISSELQSGLQSAVYTEVNEQLGTATAGFATKSDLDGCVKTASVIASINNSGESNVTIDADKVNINGIIDRLNVGELVAQYLSDGQGNRVEVKYLIDKLKEEQYYTVTIVNNNVTSHTVLYNNSNNKITSGQSYFNTFSCRESGWSFAESMTVTMGGEDITDKAVREFLSKKTTFVSIGKVTGNIVITIGNPVDVRTFTIDGPVVIHAGNEYTFEFNSNGDTHVHVSLENWDYYGPSDGSITLTPIESGTSSYGVEYKECKISGQANSNPYTITCRESLNSITALKDILIVPSYAVIPNTFSVGNYNIPKGCTAGVRKITPQITWKDAQGNVTTAPEYTLSYEVLSDYTDYLQVDSDGWLIAGDEKGYAKVKVTLTYEYGSISDTCQVWIEGKTLSESDSKVIYANILGHSDKADQISNSDGSISILLSAYTEDSTIFNLPETLIESVGTYPEGTASFVTDKQIVSTSDGIYLKINVNQYTDAINYYKNSNNAGLADATITAEKLYNRKRTETIKVTAGGNCGSTTFVIEQNGIYGIYTEWINETYASAYYLKPAEAFDKIIWKADQPIVVSDMYPHSITIYGGMKWGCLVKSKESLNMKDCTMGNYNDNYPYDKEMNPDYSD